MRSGTIILKKQILEQRTLLKRLVRLHLRDLFLMRQPITLVILQGGNRLRIELKIIDRLVIVYQSFHLDTNETAAAGRIAQQIRMVARSDKGSVTFHRFHLRSMRLAHIYDRLLQQMLQEALMPRAHLVELINIDQSETGKIQLGIPLLAEIDAVRVILIQVRWQQVEAERGLSAPLPAHQERGKAVAMLFVTSLPVRYHRQEPSVKQLFPPYVVARDACGQRTDAILAIPHGQAGQIVLDRRIVRDAI